jgi:hypothetical protein
MPAVASIVFALASSSQVPGVLSAAAVAMSRSRAASPGGRRSAAAHLSAVRRPATAAMPACESSQAAVSSSSSGSVEPTSVGTGLAAEPARIPSRTLSQLSRTAPSSPGGWS